jgi:hypothetical protein
MKVEEDLLSGAKIAKKLGLNPATIRRWRREHAPCHYIGDIVRYRLSELIAWRDGKPARDRTGSFKRA